MSIAVICTITGIPDITPVAAASRIVDSLQSENFKFLNYGKCDYQRDPVITQKYISDFFPFLL